MNKNIITVIAVVAVLLSGFALLNGGTDGRDGRDGVGASPGPDVYQRLSLRQGSANGGRVATTSTAATYTLVAIDFFETPTYIDWLPNLDTTISFSSTSTYPYVPNVGDMAKIVWRNASTTAAAAITFAAEDAGVDLQKVEATGGDLVLDGLDWGEFTIIRESNFLVSILFNEFTTAD